MKKNLQILFVFYVLFLAFKPCVDDHTVDFCQTEGIVHVEEQHSEDHSDSCSPLCNCLCCNTLVSISNHLLENNITFSVKTSISHTEILPVTFKPNSPPPKA